MAIRAVVHAVSTDPILCELDEMPDPTHSYIRLRNPRKRDGKRFEMFDDRATSFAFPWSRITFIEFYNEESAREAVVGFFRENSRH